jgi:glyoxylase-like metal-dependent hydrolase (beta-lactamase superfamily II)
VVRVEKIDSRTYAVIIDDKRTVWLIKGRRNVLVDIGYPSDIGDVYLGLEKVSMKPRDIHYLLLTHIHSDHAGGVGDISRENPSLKVFVHEKGAANIVNPEKLVLSIKRIYGEEYDKMGKILPVLRRDMVVPVKAGDTVDLGDSVLDVYYTPGHAKHHVVYFDRVSRSVFSGDALGSKYKELPSFVLCPPPEYDRESAKESINMIESLNPRRINFTHCGPYSVEKSKYFFSNLKRKHDRWTECLVEIVKENGALGEDEIFEQFLEKVPDLKEYHDQYVSFRLSVGGILLYLKKKGVI